MEALVPLKRLILRQKINWVQNYLLKLSSNFICEKSSISLKFFTKKCVWKSQNIIRRIFPVIFLFSVLISIFQDKIELLRSVYTLWRSCFKSRSTFKAWKQWIQQNDVLNIQLCVNWILCKMDNPCWVLWKIRCLLSRWHHLVSLIYWILIVLCNFPLKFCKWKFCVCHPYYQNLKVRSKQKNQKNLVLIKSVKSEGFY